MRGYGNISARTLTDSFWYLDVRCHAHIP